MSAPRVSVVIPAYRAADFLPACVERLSRQSHEDFEVVIVEDGSGDTTAEVARSLSDADPRVRAVILPENGGVAHARQRGVAESTGEYLWFIDADDSWPDTALETLVNAADGADVVVADAEFHYQDGSRRPLRAPRSAPVDGTRAFADAPARGDHGPPVEQAVPPRGDGAGVVRARAGAVGPDHGG